MNKQKFKYATLAAALLLGFSGCSNDDNPTPVIEQGTSTTFSLSVSQPTTYAADANATASESEVKTVDVYIYDASNGFIKREHLSISDFDADGSIDNKYNLKQGKAITTTTGAKRIYVGVNLPATLASAIDGSDPATVAQTIAAAAELKDPDNGFAMFSRQVQTPDLVAADAPDYTTKNTVTVSVARLLAKVAVVKGTDPSVAAGTLIGGTISDLEFAVSNVNKKFFSYPSATFLDPNHTSPWNVLADFYGAANADYKSVNANGTSIKDATTDAKVVYATENTSAGDLEAEHTYVSVRGTFVPSSIVKLNSAGDGASGLTADAAISAGTTFYSVTASSQRVFFSNQTDANAYASANTTDVATYTNGLTYYKAFLNPSPAGGERKYDVLRNTAYKVTISRINGLGEPADVTTPGTTITDATTMLVNVDVEPWTVVEQNSELAGI